MTRPFENISPELLRKASAIKLLITDCDGVLTDNGVYFDNRGEVMKRFCIRDGMGVERLRKMFGVETAIMTGETSGSVKTRADKLKLKYLYLGIKDKKAKLAEVIAETGFKAEEIAFIGDDTNDLEILGEVGLAACPGDATWFAKEAAEYHCHEKGGHGAFREFAELIIYSKQQNS